ncbi:hypothetical protein D3C71_1872480 [compost metagenome]
MAFFRMVLHGKDVVAAQYADEFLTVRRGAERDAGCVGDHVVRMDEIETHRVGHVLEDADVRPGGLDDIPAHVRDAQGSALRDAEALDVGVEPAETGSHAFFAGAGHQLSA